MTGRAENVEGTAKARDALAHANQPKSSRDDWAIGIFDEPDAIVFDFDQQPIVEVREVHVTLRGVGVFADVGDGFLDDAVGGKLDVARQTVGQILLMQLGADLPPAREAAQR